MPRPRLVARQRPAVPERVVDRRRRRVPVRGDEQLDRVQGAGADLDLLPGEPCSSSRPSSIRPTSRSSNSSTPSSRSTCGTRLSANSVSRPRSSAGAMPASARSAAAIWARLKNGTRSPSWLETSCHVGQLASVSASRSAEPSAERTSPRKRPKYSTVTRSPSSRSARVKSAISSCFGVLSEGGGHLGRADREQLGRRPRPARPQPGLDGAEAREPAACAASGTSRSRS